MKLWIVMSVAIILFFSACNVVEIPVTPINEFDQASKVPTKSMNGQLLSVLQQGGLCIEGICNREVIIYHDSTYEVKYGNGDHTEGSFSAERVNTLRGLIATADFELMRAVPFTDVCPTAYDGIEIIYTFYINGGVEIISSCAYVIDVNSSIFAAIFELLASLEN